MTSVHPQMSFLLFPETISSSKDEIPGAVLKYDMNLIAYYLC